MKKTHSPTGKEWLTPREVNSAFGFSVQTLAKWRMDNKNLSFFKFGMYIKYKRSEIVNFLERNTVEKEVSGV